MGEPKQRFDIRNHQLWGQCHIGDNVYISDMARVRGRLLSIEIDDHASLADFVMLLAEAPLLIGSNAKLMYQATVLAHEKVKICAHVKIGVGAKILSGVNTASGWFAKYVEIGTGAVISAGAVIQPGAIVKAESFIGPNEVVYA